MAVVHKLQYLKAYLSGAAANLVGHLELTDDNYALAWTLLNKRYNNKRECVSSHIRALTLLPKCNGSADDLRRLHNQISSALMALRNLGRSTDEWNDCVVVLVCDKLDIKSQNFWEHSMKNGDDLPTWDDLDNFLQGRIRALSDESAVTPATDKEDGQSVSTIAM